MGKRGQITLFIIVGLAILILTGIYVYYVETQLEEPELIPAEAEPIKAFVENCITDIAEQGLQLMADQGGYIEIPGEVERDLAYLSLGNLVKIPYWYHKGNSRIPSLSLMESQLSRYLTTRIKDCTANFQAFEKEFEIKEQETSKVLTTIGEKEVVISVEHPLIVRSKAKAEELKISKFRTALPVKLKQIYDIASRFMQEENRKTLLENVTVDLMALHPDIPFTGMEFHCGQLRWHLQDIKNKLQEMLYYNIPKLRVENTNYAPFLADKSEYLKLKKYSIQDFIEGNPKVDAPEDAYDYFHFLFDIGIKKTDIGVGFQYNPDWGMEIVARPSENGVLKSNIGKSGQRLLSFLCVNIYHFTYDVKYPVLVSVRDDNAFNNRGYVFRFAFPVLIEHNKGNRADLGNTLFDLPIEESLECSRSGKVFDIRALGKDESISNIELNNVNISYDCLQFSCPLGITNPDAGIYRLRTQLPESCANGFIVAEKEGYLPGRVQVLESSDIDVKLTKLTTLNLKVLKHKLIAGKVQEQEELTPNTVALINIKNLNDESADLIYEQYPEKDSKSDKKITLVDGSADYDLQIFLYDNADEKVIGGHHAQWTVSEIDITDKSNLIFHVIEQIPKPLSDEEQFKLITYLQDNAEYKEKLKPRFE